MHICLDLDQTLVDLNGPLLKRLSEKTGQDVSNVSLVNWQMDPLTEEQKKVVHELFLDQEFMGNLSPIPGVDFRLKDWARTGHELTVVTRRAEVLEDVTKKLVWRHFPMVDRVLLTKRDKSDLIEDCGFRVCIDDAPHFVESFLGYNVLVFMVSNERTEYNHHLRALKRVTVVKSVADVCL